MLETGHQIGYNLSDMMEQPERGSSDPKADQIAEITARYAASGYELILGGYIPADHPRPQEAEASILTLMVGYYGKDNVRAAEKVEEPDGTRVFVPVKIDVYERRTANAS